MISLTVCSFGKATTQLTQREANLVLVYFDRSLRNRSCEAILLSYILRTLDLCVKTKTLRTLCGGLVFTIASIYTISGLALVSPFLIYSRYLILSIILLTGGGSPLNLSLTAIYLIQYSRSSVYSISPKVSSIKSQYASETNRSPIYQRLPCLLCLF